MHFAPAPPSPLAASEIRAVAVAAEVDPRTVRRALAGRPIRPLSLARLEKVLRRRGQLGLLPRDEIRLSHREVRIAAAEQRAARRVEHLLAAAASAGAESAASPDHRREE